MIKSSSLSGYNNQHNFAEFGNYLFYSLNSVLYRTKKDGSDKTEIYNADVSWVCPIDEDTVVFIDTDSLAKILTISTSTTVNITKNNGVTSLCLSNDKSIIYYVNQNEENLFSYEISSTNVTSLKTLAGNLVQTLGSDIKNMFCCLNYDGSYEYLYIIATVESNYTIRINLTDGNLTGTFTSQFCFAEDVMFNDYQAGVFFKNGDYFYVDYLHIKEKKSNSISDAIKSTYAPDGTINEFLFYKNSNGNLRCLVTFKKNGVNDYNTNIGVFSVTLNENEFTLGGIYFLEEYYSNQTQEINISKLSVVDDKIFYTKSTGSLTKSYVADINRFYDPSEPTFFKTFNFDSNFVVNTTGIVATSPSGVVFKKNATLDLSDLVVTATKSNSTTETIDVSLCEFTLDDSSIDISSFSSNTEGSATLTITYSGLTTKLYLYFVSLKSLTVNYSGAKTYYKYMENQTFESIGISVSASYGHGETIMSTEEFDGSELTTLTYEDGLFGEGNFLEVNSFTLTYSYTCSITGDTISGTLDIDTALPKSLSIDFGDYEQVEFMRETNSVDFTALGITYAFVYEDGITISDVDDFLTFSNYDVSFDEDVDDWEQDAETQTVTVSCSEVSNMFDISVYPPLPVSAELVSSPTKTIFYKGESFPDDILNGISVKVTHLYGLVRTVNENYLTLKTTEDITAIVGTASIGVSYNLLSTLTVSYNVTIKEATVTGISVVAKDVNYYTSSTKINTSSLTVTATYEDSTTAVIENYALSGVDFTTSGTKEVTVSFDSFTDTFEITVEDVVATEITVLTDVTNKHYEGSEFDLTGLTFNVTYNDGSSKIIDYSETTYESKTNTFGTLETFTFSYNGVSVDYYIVINILTISTVSAKLKTNVNDNKVYYCYMSSGGSALIESDDIRTYNYIFTITFNSGKVIEIDSTTSGYKISTTVNNIDDNGRVDFHVEETIHNSGAFTYVNVTITKKKIDDLISVSSYPDKLTYYIGEELELTGMKINVKFNFSEIVSTITYNDFDLNKLSITGFDNTVAGEQTLTLRNNEKILTTFKVNVLEEPSIDLLESGTIIFNGDILVTNSNSVTFNFKEFNNIDTVDKILYCLYKTDDEPDEKKFSATDFSVNTLSSIIENISLVKDVEYTLILKFKYANGYISENTYSKTIKYERLIENSLVLLTIPESFFNNKCYKTNNIEVGITKPSYITKTTIELYLYKNSVNTKIEINPFEYSSIDSINLLNYIEEDGEYTLKIKCEDGLGRNIYKTFSFTINTATVGKVTNISDSIYVSATDFYTAFVKEGNIYDVKYFIYNEDGNIQYEGYVSDLSTTKIEGIYKTTDNNIWFNNLAFSGNCKITLIPYSDSGIEGDSLTKTISLVNYVGLTPVIECDTTVSNRNVEVAVKTSEEVIVKYSSIMYGVLKGEISSFTGSWAETTNKSFYTILPGTDGYYTMFVKVVFEDSSSIIAKKVITLDTTQLDAEVIFTNESYSKDGIVEWAWENNSENVIEYYEYSVDGGVNFEKTTTSSFNIGENNSDGLYKIIVRAVDVFGKVSKEYYNIITVDTTNPLAPIVFNEDITYSNKQIALLEFESNRDLKYIYYYESEEELTDDNLSNIDIFDKKINNNSLTLRVSSSENVKKYIYLKGADFAGNVSKTAKKLVFVFDFYSDDVSIEFFKSVPSSLNESSFSTVFKIIESEDNLSGIKSVYTKIYYENFEYGEVAEELVGSDSVYSYSSPYLLNGSWKFEIYCVDNAENTTLLYETTIVKNDSVYVSTEKEVEVNGETCILEITHIEKSDFYIINGIKHSESGVYFDLEYSLEGNNYYIVDKNVKFDKNNRYKFRTCIISL